MPQKNKSARKEYNRLQYLKRKSSQTENTSVTTISDVSNYTESSKTDISDNYYLLKFYKNIQNVNNQFLNVKLKPYQIDYKIMFNKCINAITEKVRNEKYIFNYVLLDMKLLLKTKKLEGKIYKIGYITILNPKYIKNDYNKYLRYSFETTKEPIIIDWFKSNLNGYGISLNETQTLTLLKAKRTDNESYENALYDYLNKISKIKTDVYRIKIRVLHKTMNYEFTPFGYYNAINLKYWNSKTKKTSNKNLTANHTYTYFETGTQHSRGWTFGGITIDKLQSFCYSNGLDKTSSKLFKYGDYGDWVLYKLT